MERFLQQLDLYLGPRDCRRFGWFPFGRDYIVYNVANPYQWRINLKQRAAFIVSTCYWDNTHSEEEKTWSTEESRSFAEYLLHALNVK